MVGVLQALNLFVLYNYCSITHCFYNIGFREEKSMYGGVSLLLAGVHCSSGSPVQLPGVRRSDWQRNLMKEQRPLPRRTITS